jgi:hypothetical protein
MWSFYTCYLSNRRNLRLLFGPRLATFGHKVIQMGHDLIHLGHKVIHLGHDLTHLGHPKSTQNRVIGLKIRKIQFLCSSSIQIIKRGQ